ncbi:hypothetical protein LXL04_016786 [Taraxacum kok-saghyz]
MSQIEQKIVQTQHKLQRKTDVETMKAEMEILKMKSDDFEDETGRSGRRTASGNRIGIVYRRERTRSGGGQRQSLPATNSRGVGKPLDFYLLKKTKKQKKISLSLANFTYHSTIKVCQRQTPQKVKTSYVSPTWHSLPLQTLPTIPTSLSKSYNRWMTTDKSPFSAV